MRKGSAGPRSRVVLVSDDDGRDGFVAPRRRREIEGRDGSEGGGEGGVTAEAMYNGNTSCQPPTNLQAYYLPPLCLLSGVMTDYL